MGGSRSRPHFCVFEQPHLPSAENRKLIDWDVRTKVQHQVYKAYGIPSRFNSELNEEPAHWLCVLPHVRGSGVVATELGKALADKGHELHFITYSAPALWGV